MPVCSVPERGREVGGGAQVGTHTHTHTHTHTLFTIERGGWRLRRHQLSTQWRRNIQAQCGWRALAVPREELPNSSRGDLLGGIGRGHLLSRTSTFQALTKAQLAPRVASACACVFPLRALSKERCREGEGGIWVAPMELHRKSGCGGREGSGRTGADKGTCKLLLRHPLSTNCPLVSAWASDFEGAQTVKCKP